MPAQDVPAPALVQEEGANRWEGREACTIASVTSSQEALPPTSPDRPPADLLIQQAEWLATARSRLFRRIAIAQRRCVLDLGAGYGAVTGELARRSSGFVLALDHSHLSLYEGAFSDTTFRIVGNSGDLPLASSRLDLIFCQCALLWMPLGATIDEIWRALQPGGVLLAIEPDFGAMIEQPIESSTRELWLSALKRAGAEPSVGRKLPGLLEAKGFEVRVNLLERVQPPSPSRFDMLRGLPLTEAEQTELDRIEAKSSNSSGWAQIVHLPYFLISAEKTPAHRRKQNKRP